MKYQDVDGRYSNIQKYKNLVKSLQLKCMEQLIVYNP